MSFAWLNGRFVDEIAAAVSIKDLGLLHGAGVFTTMRASGGMVFRLPKHLARLRASCDALSIPLPYDDAELTDAVNELLVEESLRAARLRITVTRGVTEQTPSGPAARPSVFLTAAAFEPYPDALYERGMTVTLVENQKLNPHDISAGHKTINYLSRFAALHDAARRGAQEALWFDIADRLQSGCVSNVFLIERGVLLTPPTTAEAAGPSCVLPGVTRGAVLDWAAEMNVERAIAPIDRARLLAADELFLTNSVMGVMPVCRLDRNAIGNEKPGPVTRSLATAFNEALEAR